jgi:NADH:ubiquinone oxidoreductase subunit K
LNRFVDPDHAYGVVFTLFIMGIAAAEAAIALGVILLIFRRFKHMDGEDLTEMKD